jgi:hypothetical protein
MLMDESPLTWTTELLPGGILRVAFMGRGRVGSEGNPDGDRMREAIHDALAAYNPTALVIDLRRFEYCFGNWIAAAPLAALRALGPHRVCVLVTGETATALHRLWESVSLQQIVPLVGELADALSYLTNQRLE